MQESRSGLHHVYVEMHCLSDPDEGGVISGDSTVVIVLVFAMVRIPWPAHPPVRLSTHAVEAVRYGLSSTGYRAKPIVSLSQAVATRAAASTLLRDFGARQHATFPGGWSLTPPTLL